MTAPRRVGRVPRLLPRLLLSLVLGLAASGCGLAEDGAYDLPLPGGADTGSDPATITVHLDSVQGLVPLASVELDDVPVGQVEDIELQEEDWSAVVTVELRSDLDLPGDVGARVRRSSLLGEWYLELVRPDASVAAPASGTLADGDTIPAERVAATAGVEEVLGALSLLLNNGGLPQLDTILSELTAALDGNEAEVQALLAEAARFTGQLDQRRSDVVAALDGLARLSRVLRGNEQRIAAALDGLPAGLRVLADQRPQLVEMLRALDRLSDVTVRVVERSREDAVADLRLLQPVLASLRRSGTDLTDALEILATFPFTPAAGDAVLGDYVNLDSKVDLDLALVLASLSGPQSGLPAPPALPALPALPGLLAGPPKPPVLPGVGDLVEDLPGLPGLPGSLPATPGPLGVLAGGGR